MGFTLHDELNLYNLIWFHAEALERNPWCKVLKYFCAVLGLHVKGANLGKEQFCCLLARQPLSHARCPSCPARGPRRPLGQTALKPPGVPVVPQPSSCPHQPHVRPVLCRTPLTLGHIPHPCIRARPRVRLLRRFADCGGFASICYCWKCTRVKAPFEQS